MSRALKNHVAGIAQAKAVTPQSQVIPGREKDMAPNSGGGVSFILNDWDRLDRFLILGSDGGSYAVSERKLTKDNATNVVKLINQDGIRVVNRVVEISQAGRAPKNDQALFVLALASAADDTNTRRAALDALPKVARIGTHLFQFAEYVESFRGWGRTLRKAVADWYLDKPIDQLALDVVKYQSRTV